MLIPTDETVRTDSIDFKRMAADAMAAGFNPLTVLRAGAAAGYGVSKQVTSYAEQSASALGGSFTSFAVPSYAASPSSDLGYAVEPASLDHGGQAQRNGSYWNADGTPKRGVIDGVDWDQVWRNNPSGESNHGDSVHDRSSRDHAAEIEYQFAVEQLRRQLDGVITDDGRVVGTRKAPTGGTMLNPISYTGAPAVRGVPVSAGAPGQSYGPAGEGFQPKQVYQTDKLPNVVAGNTMHYILPGIGWEELGGATRGEVWETIYGEEGPHSWMLSTPKFVNDVIHNFNRLDSWAANNVRPGGAWSSTPNGKPRYRSSDQGGGVSYDGGMTWQPLPP